MCSSVSISEKFIKCEQCARDLCWNHFKELGSVGRVICPYCDGSVTFLPQYCEKCHLDYIKISSAKKNCEFCGYPVKVKEHLIDFYREFQTIQKSPSELKRAEDDYTKETK